jgi:hypothetical protein
MMKRVFHAKTQRRKGRRKESYLEPGRLCAFAPLREKSPVETLWLLLLMTIVSLFDVGMMKRVFHAKAQRRKGRRKESYLEPGRLCAFAPLREKSAVETL